MAGASTSSRAQIPNASHWGAFQAIVEDGKLVGIEPFANDPVPAHFLSALIDAPYSEKRIRRPSVRRGWLENGPTAGALRGADDFVEMDWDEVLDRIAAELTRVRRDHGDASVFGGSYGWSSAGRFHHAKSQLQRFLAATGGYTDAIHNYSIAAGLAVLPHILGSSQACEGPVTTWDSIAGSGELVVAFGGLPLKNMQVAPGGPGAHEDPPLLAEARAAGVRFVNISPLKSDMDPTLDGEWVPIRPNTDTAFMLALIHVLVDEGLADRSFLASHCVGAGEVEDYVLGRQDGVPKTPEWAETITGIAAGTCRQLARRMAAHRTLVTAAWSLQRADHGEQPFWALVALAAFLGQIGLPGAGFSFGHASMGGMGSPRRSISSPRLPKLPNPVDTAIPVARIADMLLSPGATYEFNGERKVYPDIRLVYWCGGNPFHHHQDLNRLTTAFRRPETIIVHEPWWTSTARLADIVLPATTTLERNDIGASGRDRFILAMKQAIAPVGDARDDHDIFRALARRMGVEHAFAEGLSEKDWLRRIYQEARTKAGNSGENFPDFDRFWAKGHAEIPRPDAPYDLFAAFRADPEKSPLATPSGRIELVSARVRGFGYDECPGQPVWIEPREWLGAPLAKRYPIHLLSNQPKNRLHSQLDFATPSQASKIGGKEAILINSEDARARGIVHGDTVRVLNDRGATLAAAIPSDDVMSGVAILPTGAWYAPEHWGDPGSLDQAGNPNVLTADFGTSRLGQGPSAQTTLVEIVKDTGAARSPEQP